MKPAPFEYHAPQRVDELVQICAETSADGRVLAGGQSLVPLMAARLVRPMHLVDLNGVEGLDFVEIRSDALVVGALARQACLLEHSRAVGRLPILSDATAFVGSPSVRHRGTVCGSLAFANSSGELPAASLAVGGEVLVSGANGDRVIDLDAFFVGPNATAIALGEVLLEVRYRLWPRQTGYAFLEASRMRWPVVCVAAMATLADSVVSRLAIAIGGIAETPIRARAIEAELSGGSVSLEALGSSTEQFLAAVAPTSDVYGSADYRRHVGRALVQRAVKTAVGRAITNGNPS